jgi:large subunit ribosomal protein L22
VSLKVIPVTGKNNYSRILAFKICIMEAVAKLRNIPMSPRKMRLVVDLVRGKSIDEALGILKYTNKEASVWLEKLLISAISNWENKTEGSADEHDLYIKTIFSDGGTMLKRFRPAPHGRAHRIRKRTNHVTLVLENRKELAAAGE